MTHPGFPPQPGFRPQPGQFSPQQRPTGWQPPVQNFRGGGPTWQPAPTRPRKQRSPLTALLFAGIILVALLGYAFSSQPGNDVVESNYQNEDYVLPRTDDSVSRIPIPEYESEILQWLQDNTLYPETLAAPVRCDVAALTNAKALSDAQLQARMRSYVGCLTRVWGPALEASGHEAYQPTLYVYPAGGEVTTSCGTQGSLNAFYCGADQNLYLAADILRILPTDAAEAPEALDLVIAHEYGHAVQGRTGVFAASQYLAQDSTSDSGAREVSRRVELQADCFAGTAINSVSDSMNLGEQGRTSVGDISYEIGDDRLAERFDQPIEEGDHGTGENRRLWATRGLDGGQLTGCNTFVAPTSEVR